MTEPDVSRCFLSLAALLLAASLAGCTGVHVGGTAHYPASAPPARDLHVPPGHYPPPGKCRIWYPGVPPGQQPPPGECSVLRYQVPSGAILLRGD